ncbi:HORMA domain-containing protein [Panaeolus papilionaceus]|nr:HORMA domain-containing protein [Panaeolus papilionaceus]
MQAQAVRTVTKPISQTQSLAAVQTLLRAGLGAITFLRNLLPEENFTQSHLTTFDESLLLSSEADLSQPTPSQSDTDPRRNVNSFKITTMSRGYTDEADRILNYLEFGIFDALEKQYLRRFIFAVYLDNKNPQSIVEAYTFDFKLQGHDIAFPVMTLDGGKKPRRQQSEDAVAKAIREGKVPTLLDVKSSVKAMLKTLIQAMNTMEVLPRRRFATFKIYYTDAAPSDYEPPYFQTGDVDKDKWYLMTHNLDEEPDRYSIGSVSTGHHSVSLNVASIAAFLPTSTAHNDAIFSGLSNKPPGKSVLTPLQEAKAAQDQVAKQLQDAETRKVVWSAEDDPTDDDAEGEDDPDFAPRRDDGLAPVAPLGILDENGNLTSLPAESLEEEEEARFGGVSQAVPQNLIEIVSLMIFNGQHTYLCRERSVSQQIPTWKKRSCLHKKEQGVGLHRYVLDVFSNGNVSDEDDVFDQEMLKAINLDHANDDEMLDLETQVQRAVRPAETFGTMISTPGSASIHTEKAPTIDNGLQCACGISVEDPMCFCEAGCGRWFHVWCMGYHSAQDATLPATFHCFDCRVRGDLSWDIIKLDIYPGMVTKFESLATFRRAIKVAEDLSRFNLIEFTKAFGGESALVRQMINRLKVEEFIVDDVEQPKNQHPTRNTKSNKAPTKPPKARKHVAKSAYFRFQRSLISQDQYKQYFLPNDQAIEQQHLGVQELLRSKRTALALEKGSRTGAKRVGDDAESKDAPRKRVKISVARAVDLAE